MDQNVELESTTKKDGGNEIVGVMDTINDQYISLVDNVFVFYQFNNVEAYLFELVQNKKAKINPKRGMNIYLLGLMLRSVGYHLNRIFGRYLTQLPPPLSIGALWYSGTSDAKILIKSLAFCASGELPIQIYGTKKEIDQWVNDANGDARPKNEKIHMYYLHNYDQEDERMEQIQLDKQTWIDCVDCVDCVDCADCADCDCAFPLDGKFVNNEEITPKDWNEWFEDEDESIISFNYSISITKHLRKWAKIYHYDKLKWDNSTSGKKRRTRNGPKTTTNHQFNPVLGIIEPNLKDMHIDELWANYFITGDVHWVIQIMDYGEDLYDLNAIDMMVDTIIESTNMEKNGEMSGEDVAAFIVETYRSLDEMNQLTQMMIRHMIFDKNIALAINDHW